MIPLVATRREELDILRAAIERVHEAVERETDTRIAY